MIGTWSREERRESSKIMLRALVERRIGRRDQASAWIWRLAEYTRDLHEEYAVQRWPETKRLLGLLVNSSGGAHARNARRLIHASRKQDRRLAAALLAAALAHTPEAEEALRGARTRMARKPPALARELLRNFPKRRARKAAAGAAARESGATSGEARRRRKAPEGELTRVVDESLKRSADGAGVTGRDRRVEELIAERAADGAASEGTVARRGSRRRRAAVKAAPPRSRREGAVGGPKRARRRRADADARPQPGDDEVSRSTRRRGVAATRAQVHLAGRRASPPRRLPARRPGAPRRRSRRRGHASATREPPASTRSRGRAARRARATRRSVSAAGSCSRSRERAPAARSASARAPAARARASRRCAQRAGSSSSRTATFRPIPSTAQSSWGRPSIRMPASLASAAQPRARAVARRLRPRRGEHDVVRPLDQRAAPARVADGDRGDQGQQRRRGAQDQRREHRAARRRRPAASLAPAAGV